MKKIFTIILSVVIGLNLSVKVWGQVNISEGNTITQDFNIMGTSATATLPAGWKVDNDQSPRIVGTYSNASTSTTQNAGNDMSSTAQNGIYNFAAGDADSATDRAVGGISSSSKSKSVNVYVQLKNMGSTDINSFTISYDIEKYRKGTNEKGFSIQMYYSTDGIDWTSAGNDFLTSFSKDSDNNGYNPAPGETKSVSSKTLNQALAVGSSIYLAWNYSVTSGSTTSNAQALGIDNVSITANGGVPTPTINVNPVSLTNLDYYLGYGPSEEQSFTVSGTNLTNNISLTAPTNYEICLDQYGIYGNSISLSPASGSVPETLIYVRLKAGLNLGSYNSEIITITSTGASSKTVSCSGSVSLAPVTNLSLICSTNSTAEVSWTSPASDYDGIVIAFRNSTNPPHTLSLDPSDINANPVFGSGTLFGTTTPYSYVVYKSTGNSVLVTGLTAGQTYKVKAYVYKGTNWLPDAQCPTITVSDLGLSNVSLAQKVDGNAESELSWVLPSAACFDQILVVARQGSSVAYTPTGDGSTLTANSIFGSGDDVGSNQYVVYKETGTGLTITGLTNDETYYAKIFVRKGTDWSSGIEIELKPMLSSIFEHGDLAILAINTSSSFGDEISFVSFKPIIAGTAIDFTDNGYERLSENLWGDTEGTIRLTRKNSNIEAGKVITLEINGGKTILLLGTDANIYIDGNNDNSNWELETLGGSIQFDLNNEDQLWIMQNGNWVNPSDSHDAVYTGNVLYGWTATGWKTAPGYASTSGSTIYPGCECATTNVTGLTYKSKVKYTGSLDPANKFEWIARINNASNWIGFASDADFNNTEPKYKTNETTLIITPTDSIEAKWMGYKSHSWYDCSNWYNLRVPNENTDVEITPHNSLRFDLKLSAHPDSLAVCKDLIVKGDVYNAANASLKVKGNFTLDGGSVNFNTNAINFEIGGDMSIDNVNSFKTSQANTKLNGTSIQNINGNSEVVFGTLTIDKPSAHVVLAKNIKVSNINFIKGKINTGTNRVFIDNTATNAIGSISPLSYINGNLRRAVASTGSYTLPVGNDSNFELATVELNSSSGLTHLDARFDSHVTSTDISSLNLFVDGTILQSLLDAGYWTIAPNSGLSSINYDISLDMRGATNAGAQAGQHTVIKRDNSSSNWYLQGNHTNATQSISGGSVHAVRTGLTSFSEFSIAKHNLFILPVELISFEANCNTDFVELNWITVSETNNDYFIVQRSQDATNWKNLSKIQGAGFSSSEKEYEYIDNTQVSGNMYYRLVQVDFDGTKTISNIVNVNCINKFEIPNISIYPNPANDILNFSQAQTYEILDIQGRVLMQSKTKQNSVNISELKEGMYFIKFENELLKFIKY